MRTLLTNSTLKHQAIPFNEINNQDFIPALQVAIDDAKKKIDAINQNPNPATFTNTILPYIECRNLLEKVSAVFYGLYGAHCTEDLQSIVKEFEPMISAFSNDINLNLILFEKIKYVYDHELAQLQDVEQKTLLQKSYLHFKKNGALLNETEKEKLRAIDQELAELTPKYSQNILNAKNENFIHITEQSELSGIPEKFILNAAKLAKAKKLSGWVFTLHPPILKAAITYADHEHLRKSFWIKNYQLNSQDKYDNSENTIRIATLRHQRSLLLGYKTYAEFALEDRMAKTAENVWKFIDQMRIPSHKAASKNLIELQSYKKQLGNENPFMPWDIEYYTRKLKEEKFTFSEDELKKYFSAPQVIEGVFLHATKLYDLTFKLLSDLPTYHPDVQVYEVSHLNGNFQGLLYLDLYNRDTKKPGAYCGRYRGQWKTEAENIRPHVTIVCNFEVAPPGELPLLKFAEVNTLFHEFGHALHNLLSDCQYRSLSCTSVYRDFVELPSQIMENWLLEDESLKLYAKHFETGANIPEDLIKKIKISSNFLSGISFLRQINFSTLDMSWHSQDPSTIKDIREFERNATKNTVLIPTDKSEGCISNSFSHIFAGGYAAGYYSYKWAEVLDKDAFSLFKEKGIFSKEVANSFQKNILSKGGSEDPMELYLRFRGSEPKPESLLKHYDII